MKVDKDIYIDELKLAIDIVRDDLFPGLGGGNKNRKISYITRKIIADGYNAIVTTGGVQSNHCRATAVLAAKEGFSCTLVLHGDPHRFKAESGNAKLMRMSGANIVFVDDPGQIGPTMDLEMKKFNDKGLKPYYLRGGGHDVLGGKAYIDATVELFKQYQPKSLPNYIFLATGTGSTQAGIMAGLSKLRAPTKVIGVSVGRTRVSAETHVSSFYYELCDQYDITKEHVTTVTDLSLCGGYEKYDDEILELAETSLSTYGFCLDKTYTAKAFIGMKKYIEKQGISDKVSFWHTGGLLNFLTS